MAEVIVVIMPSHIKVKCHFFRKIVGVHRYQAIVINREIPMFRRAHIRFTI